MCLEEKPSNQVLQMKRMAGEDERQALSNRFRDEGLGANLSDGQKLPHVWRWLVDAETNCLSLRHQMDKLHRQHEQDLKEVEEYLEQVWKLSNERLFQLEEENKSLKKTLTEKGNLITCDLKHEKKFNNLCDSLKLKSGLKQILQNAKGDSNSIVNEILNNNNYKTTKARRNSTTNDHLEQVKGLQDMCQQFQIQINDLEDKIQILEKSNTNLEIENETLSYKLSESQTQCDELELQLLKFNKRQTDFSNEETKSKVGGTNDETLESLQFLLASRISNAQNDITLVKQLHDLRNDKQILEIELQKKDKLFKQLINKYDRKKSRHRESMLRLRSHIERENRQLQELLNSTDYKYKIVEQELLQHRKYCAIAGN